ncbi:MAG: HlyD family efflux transporter periplasmic adaptor subunit [Chitinophagales bacterium]
MSVRPSFYPILFILIFFSSCGKKTTTTQPVRKDITETVFASGTLEPDHSYNLTAQTEGYLIQLDAEEGSFVTAGKTVAVIDNPQNAINTEGAKALLSVATSNASLNAPAFKQIEANIKAAEEKLRLEEVQYERYKNLYESGAATKMEFEQRELAYTGSKASLEALHQSYKVLQKQTEQQLIAQKTQTRVNAVLSSNNQLKVVVSGKVYKKFKERGDYVKKGDIIATIGNPANIYAKLSIDESNISKVQVGQEVAIQLNTNKEKIYKAVIYEILPSFDEANQSFYAKAHFTDSLDFRISKTQLQANIIIGTKKNVLLIPRNYLGYGNKVMVKDAKEPSVVETGFVSNEWVEITKGLDEKATIISDRLK